MEMLNGIKVYSKKDIEGFVKGAEAIIIKLNYEFAEVEEDLAAELYITVGTEDCSEEYIVDLLEYGDEAKKREDEGTIEYKDMPQEYIEKLEEWEEEIEEMNDECFVRIDRKVVHI